MQDYDIIFPRGNETKLIEMAKRLGWEKLYLVYALDECLAAKKEKNEWDCCGLELNLGVVATPKNIQEATRMSEFVIVRSTLDPNIDRQLFENKRIKMIYDLELTGRRDSYHHRNSGLNQVLCKLAAKNGITIGLSFNSLLAVSGMRRAQILGRMKQNIRFCEKFGVKKVVGSFARDEWEMRGKCDIGLLL